MVHPLSSSNTTPVTPEEWDLYQALSAEDAKYLESPSKEKFRALFFWKTAHPTQSFPTESETNEYIDYLEVISLAKAKARNMRGAEMVVYKGFELLKQKQDQEERLRRQRLNLEPESFSWLKVLPGVMGVVGVLASLAGAVLLAVSLIFGWGVLLIALFAFILVGGLASGAFSVVKRCSS